MSINRILHGVSTLITVVDEHCCRQGTGFFYMQTVESDSEPQGSHWRQVGSIWLVTNRHILLTKLNDEEENVPKKLIFRLRRLEDEQLAWEPINLSTAELISRAKVHTDRSVDVAAIRIDDKITSMLGQVNDPESTQQGLAPFLGFGGIGNFNLPESAKVPIEVGGDVLVIGYPRGFYDERNLFPIVKSGIIATPPDLDFEGKPYFLIDAKLFPGSSGSAVITKPIDFKIENGRAMYSTSKHFAFLGVYSGGPYRRESIDLGDFEIIRKENFNLGIVWHARLVEDLISTGQTLRQL